jgi:segregation and condensation protein B
MEIDVEVSEAEPTAPSEASDPHGPEPKPGAGRARLGPGEEKSEGTLLRELAALLFAAPEPLSSARLLELLERPSPARLQAALERLRSELDAGALPLVLRELGGAWSLLSDPELAPVVQRLRTEPKPERISAAALETLAIVAYRQPVTKAEIEAIRGVHVGPILRSLVDRGLVRITGRAELPGHPLLYGTTKEFLERFGLGALKDLPRDGELNED